VRHGQDDELRHAPRERELEAQRGAARLLRVADEWRMEPRIERPADPAFTIDGGRAAPRAAEDGVVRPTLLLRQVGRCTILGTEPIR